MTMIWNDNAYLAGALTGALAGCVMTLTVNSLLSSPKDTTNKKDDKLVEELLTFPDPEYPCNARGQACPNRACRRLHGRPNEPPSSSVKLIRYMLEANKTLDICIYAFTQANLASSVILLHQKGVVVRVIADVAFDREATGSQLDKLSQLGIEVKCNKNDPGAMMHNKFVIVDRRLTLSGSFNWTNKAILCNDENIAVSSSPTLADQYATYFDKLWQRSLPYERGRRFGC